MSLQFATATSMGLVLFVAGVGVAIGALLRLSAPLMRRHLTRRMGEAVRGVVATALREAMQESSGDTTLQIASAEADSVLVSIGRELGRIEAGATPDGESYRTVEVAIAFCRNLPRSGITMKARCLLADRAALIAEHASALRRLIGNVPTLCLEVGPARSLREISEDLRTYPFHVRKIAQDGKLAANVFPLGEIVEVLETLGDDRHFQVRRGGEIFRTDDRLRQWTLTSPLWAEPKATDICNG